MQWDIFGEFGCECARCAWAKEIAKVMVDNEAEATEPVKLVKELVRLLERVDDGARGGRLGLASVPAGGGVEVGQGGYCSTLGGLVGRGGVSH